MSTLVLLRNESIKSTRRVAMWVSIGAWALLYGVGTVGAHRAAAGTGGRAFALPESWPRIIEPGQISFFFLAGLLVLLVASEYSWKTARQNVIDGLSKEQFFLGKLLLLPLFALVFFTLTMLIGGVGAAIGEGMPTAVMRASDARMSAAYALGLVGFGSIALLLATCVRGTGSALAVFFLYAAFLERMIGAGVGLLGPRLAAVDSHLPVSIFLRLVDPVQWDPTTLARATARLAESGGAPHVMDGGVLVGTALAYAVLFIVAAFLIFRARDL